MRRAWLMTSLLICAATARAAVGAELEVEIVGDKGTSTRVLKAAARRDLERYEKDPRPGALHDAAWDMESELRHRGHPDARVSFQADPGSWSAVGRDALNAAYFPLHQPTMN